jgi:reactive intermediate/imine deaminase
MSRTIIHTDDAPDLPAPLSQAVRKGPVLQVSGQLPLDPATGAIAGSTVGEQAAQAVRNIDAVLKVAGADMQDVIMLRVYLTDPSDLAELNDAYAAAVGRPYPARTTAYMPLPAGILVEIDALAVLEG